MNDITNNCSRCGAKLDNLKIFISLSIYVERLKDTGIWEEIPNLDQISNDILCEDCFDEFASILEQMNTPSDEQKKNDMLNKQKDPLKNLNNVESSSQVKVEEKNNEKVYEEELEKIKKDMHTIIEKELQGETLTVEEKNQIDSLYERKIELEKNINDKNKNKNKKDKQINMENKTFKEKQAEMLKFVEIKEDCIYASENKE